MSITLTLTDIDIKIQWNRVNADTKGTRLVSILIGVSKKNITDTKCRDIKKTKRKKVRNKNCGKKPRK